MKNIPIKYLERLERLERDLLIGREIEDLRATDIEIYGLEAVKEIYKTEGAESLREVMKDSSLSEEAKAIIADFLSRKNKKQEEIK